MMLRSNHNPFGINHHSKIHACPFWASAFYKDLIQPLFGLKPQRWNMLWILGMTELNVLFLTLANYLDICKKKNYKMYIKSIFQCNQTQLFSKFFIHLCHLTSAKKKDKTCKK